MPVAQQLRADAMTRTPFRGTPSAALPFFVTIQKSRACGGTTSGRCSLAWLQLFSMHTFAWLSSAAPGGACWCCHGRWGRCAKCTSSQCATTCAMGVHRGGVDPMCLRLLVTLCCICSLFRASRVRCGRVLLPFCVHAAADVSSRHQGKRTSILPTSTLDTTPRWASGR